MDSPTFSDNIEFYDPNFELDIKAMDAFANLPPPLLNHLTERDCSESFSTDISCRSTSTNQSVARRKAGRVKNEFKYLRGF